MKKWFLAAPLVLLLLWWVGPKPQTPVLPNEIGVTDLTPEELEAAISAREARVEGLKPDNQSRIIWANEDREKTPYVILYLHGWSASYMEGDPVHRTIARRYGANLYLPRLYGHGIDLGDETFGGMTATQLMASAANALAEAKVLGDSVILMGTSTGGTLGLYLATIDPVISGLILYSPNIRVRYKTAFLLNDPWGYQIARFVTGSAYYGWEAEDARKQYWTTHYRLKALTELQELLETAMVPNTFEKVTLPVFTGYYYKNDSLQDNTVSVQAIREMFPLLGSDRKRMHVFPDVGHHVMASSLTSDDIPSVLRETIDFMENEMALVPVSPELEATR